MTELTQVYCMKTTLVLLLCCHQQISQVPFHLYVLSLERWVLSVKLTLARIYEDLTTS